MSTLTAEKFMEMKRLLDEKRLTIPSNEDFLSDLIGMRVIESPHLSDTYEETETYKGHPIIQWLAKFIRFDPDVHVTRVRHRRPHTGYMFRGNLIVRPTTANMMRGLAATTTA